MRLDKFLADSGKGTRSEIKKLIKDGFVTVKGMSNLKPETKIDENKDDVFLFDKKVAYKKYVYLMLNKPKGYVSATWDKRLPVVIDLVPDEYNHYDLFPVGRLDIDTEGLLVLTNDGQLSHKILSPKYHVPKMYYADIKGIVTGDDIENFKNGVMIEGGYITKPACLSVISYNDEYSKIYVTITEGKFHQVKQMFEAVNKEVVYLKRVKMNNLLLDENLELGEMRELSEDEVYMLSAI